MDSWFLLDERKITLVMCISCRSFYFVVLESCKFVGFADREAVFVDKVIGKMMKVLVVILLSFLCVSTAENFSFRGKYPKSTRNSNDTYVIPFDFPLFGQVRMICCFAIPCFKSDISVIQNGLMILWILKLFVMLAA
jgi:hypothetical protein